MSMMVTIVDWVCFLAMGLSVMYLFVFALFSMRKRENPFPEAKIKRRFVILIPAYREDAVIEQSVDSVLRQDYPKACFDTVVVADKFRRDTIERLSQLPIRLLDVDFEASSKAKALNYAIEQLGGEAFDVVVILDADNTVGSDFLHQLNNAYQSGAMAIQAHRKAKNRNTDTAVLDAVSEEINNSIFRKGHVALGISSALIGSGMAFDYKWFRTNVPALSTAGEDKELEILLLKQGVFIEYLDQVEVLDEKTQKGGAFYNQRRRWLAAQFYSLTSALRDLPGAITSGNIDYCDKLFQWMLPPRVLLLGLIPLFGVATLFVDWTISVKWWILFVLLLFALAFAIPDDLVDARFKKALRKIPVMFVFMALNVFRIRGAKNKFIHTAHGEEA